MSRTVIPLSLSIVFFPPFIIFFLSHRLDIHFLGWVWFITIIYIGFAWSFSCFLEQMFTAELYLFHLKLEKECEVAKKEGKELLRIKDIQRPTLMDNIPDLANLKR